MTSDLKSAPSKPLRYQISYDYFLNKRSYDLFRAGIVFWITDVASSALSTPIASVTFVTHTTCAFLLSCYCCISCYCLSACASKVWSAILKIRLSLIVPTGLLCSNLVANWNVTGNRLCHDCLSHYEWFIFFIFFYLKLIVNCLIFFNITGTCWWYLSLIHGSLNIISFFWILNLFGVPIR